MKLLFTGDYCPAEIDFRDFSIDPDLLALLESAEAVFGNLECPFTRKSAVRKGQFINLKAEPETNSLTEKFTAFSLANNHILDFGEEGARDTIDFLHNTGIKHFGYGRTPEEAAMPCRIKSGGGTVALFGITQWYVGNKSKSGTCSDRNRRLFQNIRECRESGDFIVVMPHWNYEFADFPSPASRKLAERLLLCGANLIVGAHPHVVNGLESFGDKSVAYSLGNFLVSPKLLFSENNTDSRRWQSILLECSVSSNFQQHTLAFHPVQFSENSIELMTGENKEQFIRKFNRLNSFFESGKPLKKAFYGQAPLIFYRVSSNMKSMNNEQGLWTIASRLHKIRLQDILVGIHAKLKRR